MHKLQWYKYFYLNCRSTKFNYIIKGYRIKLRIMLTFPENMFYETVITQYFTCISEHIYHLVTLQAKDPHRLSQNLFRVQAAINHQHRIWNIHSNMNSKLKMAVTKMPTAVFIPYSNCILIQGLKLYICMHKIVMYDAINKCYKITCGSFHKCIGETIIFNPFKRYTTPWI